MDKQLILDTLMTNRDRLRAEGLQPRIPNQNSAQWLPQVCTLIGIPKEGIEIAQEILSLKPPTHLIWLHMAECSGCSESLLRVDKPGLDSLLLDYLIIEYHETIMGAVGFGAKKSFHDALHNDFLLVVEGGVSLGADSYFLTSGADACSGEQECREAAQKARAIFAVGTCSSFGGVQAAFPNPTNSVGIDTFLSQKVINIPGCPPSETNIIGTLIYYILFEQLPELDSLNRPLWSYGRNLHDMCERKAKFESGDFAQSFDDPHLADGFCLYKVGCKGPYVSNNCPKVKFNAKTSWPVRAGHGCMACSEPSFWDSFGHIEEPLNNTSAYLREPRIMHKLARTYTSSQLLSEEAQVKPTLCLMLDTNAPCMIYHASDDQWIGGKSVAYEKSLLILHFQSYLPGLLAQIASKNKLGARLVENYISWRKSIGLIPLVPEECEVKSNNLSDLFMLVAQIFGENIRSGDVFNYAQEYLFPHVSKLDYKISLNQDEERGSICEMEIDRSLRLILCYLLGGLEIEGVAYGVVSSVCEALASALTELCKAHNLEQVALKGDMLAHDIIQDRLSEYLPQWIKVV